MKAYKIELLVIDFENVGKMQCIEYLSEQKYLDVQIVDTQSADIGEWNDDHPLNSGDHKTWSREYNKLFK